MAEIKQMILAMRVHIKIISPHAVNISSVSLSDAGLWFKVTKTNKHSVMIHSIVSKKWHDVMWCWQHPGPHYWLLTSNDRTMARVFLPQRSLGSTPSITSQKPLWTNSYKNRGPPHNTGYGELGNRSASINVAGAAISWAQCYPEIHFSDKRQSRRGDDKHSG